MAGKKKHPSDRYARRNELIISAVLQAGVIASTAVLIIGLGMLCVQRDGAIRSVNAYHRITSPSYSFPHTFSSVHAGLSAGNSQAYIMVGLLLLILTPILRVVVSVLLFAYERDKPMTLITLFALMVLISSYFIGMAT